MLVSEWVTEGHFSKWGTTTWVVDDFSDDSLEVSVAFSEVE
jgi:hypothetical protein